MADKVPDVKLNNGQLMPVLGYGTWNFFKENQVRDALRVAIDIGYRHIDTASVYKTEPEIGEAVEGKIKDGAIKRSDLFITSKLWNTYHDPEWVEFALKKSLKALRTDYLDLYLMHWPFAVDSDDKESFLFEEGLRPSKIKLLDTWRAMEELVLKGLVKSIGLSNFNAEQVGRILNDKNLRVKPVVNQVEIHPYFTNAELVDYCQKVGVVVTAYSPLAKGGEEITEQKPPDTLTDPTIVKIAKRHGKTPAQVVLRWGIDRGYTLVPKSVTPSRIKENFEIFDFSLTPEEVKEINGLNRNYKCITHLMFKDYPEFPFTWLI
ncbi:hypothetical protein LOTGIDRAFT_225865 [Lottia gigantea]|uniref:NADP-dependent oxidoreductase domain-containing protein n=1 Tax=Lottia gigantea TaxID=225164 RepID=V4B296_LOTGI|nr:hypothetical protein LOTGIDRAFT_225865 [Lottia gigantea]ESP00397.1 hypothetical protein LOTGIDRAFT_225865 [Lottia gigantea]